MGHISTGGGASLEFIEKGEDTRSPGSQIWYFLKNIEEYTVPKKSIIAGNWKMNLTLTEVHDFFQQLSLPPQCPIKLFLPHRLP